ncbi:cyclic AMP-responsive element-binding protein [Eurytemora carolleeae]|uniref:cyclic AMP-responsive element-binding protein n=1 Tax=Eurytemora carolleeae TaxID=1294199 RepID=UPI000C76AF30|nr:cyclic AMP-responsive element-binding protein [Eurytemora carolleeae]|eukprot:XP_023349181.1 cyclic AMP-responsive element-binding protein-like [Eurytemora affinis]
MKGESVELVESNSASHGQTVVINGQQYQIVSPSAMDSVISLHTGSGGNQFTSSNGGTVFLPSATSPGLSGPGSSPGSQAEEQARKREVRLMKNREAARECRNKKKEYIKCLENRVAVLENQNKALIEELKSLKELYKSQN